MCYSSITDLTKTGQYAKAYEMFYQLYVDEKPQNVEYLRNAAFSANKAGKNELAYEHFIEAYSLDGNIESLKDACGSIGNIDVGRAITCLERLLSEKPGYSDAA